MSIEWRLHGTINQDTNPRCNGHSIETRKLAPKIAHFDCITHNHHYKIKSTELKTLESQRIFLFQSSNVINHQQRPQSHSHPHHKSS